MPVRMAELTTVNIVGSDKKYNVLNYSMSTGGDLMLELVLGKSSLWDELKEYPIDELPTLRIDFSTGAVVRLNSCHANSSDIDIIENIQITYGSSDVLIPRDEPTKILKSPTEEYVEL